MYVDENVGAKPRYASFYGKGLGPIFLAEIKCDGSELSLLDCNRNTYSALQCTHSEDAGIKCLGIHTAYEFKKFEFVCRFFSSLQ